jgi:aspartate aminotransferase
MTPAQLDAAITPRTKWLMLNSPSNPSGAVYSPEETRALVEVLERHPHVWILADDMYEHIVFDGRPFISFAEAAPQLGDRTLVVNGASKTYAMTGWRLGYGAGPATLIRAMARMQAQCSLNPSSISQAAVVAALNGPQDLVAQRCAEFQVRRDEVLPLLNAIPGLSCTPPDGAFYIYISCADWIGRRTPGGQQLLTDVDVGAYLLESGVAVPEGRLRPVSVFQGVVCHLAGQAEGGVPADGCGGAEVGVIRGMAAGGVPALTHPLA